MKDVENDNNGFIPFNLENVKMNTNINKISNLNNENCKPVIEIKNLMNSNNNIPVESESKQHTKNEFQKISKDLGEFKQEDFQKESYSNDEVLECSTIPPKKYVQNIKLL